MRQLVTLAHGTLKRLGNRLLLVGLVPSWYGHFGPDEEVLWIASKSAFMPR
jgi:hypothetical protein